jgi:uncharacterized membrane protein YfcA
MRFPWTFGQITWTSLWVSVTLMPLTLMGVVVGITLHRKISQQLFTKLAYIFLTAAAVKLIYDGVVGMLMQIYFDTKQEHM